MNCIRANSSARRGARAGLTTLMLVALAGAGAACSHRQMYEGLQASKRQQCLKLAEPDRARCLDEANKGYDRYERERDVVKPD
jgi:hypothetical protein